MNPVALPGWTARQPFDLRGGARSA
jgi:hypothetical protein